MREETQDVLTVLAVIGDLPRKEGELAFPEVGAIIAATRSAGQERHNREHERNRNYQQQVCPQCGGVVGMIRPTGEQFRTFCLSCQVFRKIHPEDLTLTGEEWRLLCAELDAQYHDWKRLGSPVYGRIDPQLDRERFRGAV